MPLTKKFNREIKKTKYRNVSPKWEIKKVSNNHIHCENVMGGGITFQESGSVNKRGKAKMMLRIKTRRGIEKRKFDDNPMRLLEYMVNYMRRESCN